MTERVPRVEQKPGTGVESIESFEQFKSAVKEAAGIESKRRFLIHEIDPFRLERGELEIVKGVPEFRDLIKLEEELIAAGPSRAEIKKYGDLYKRVRRRRDEMLLDLNAKRNKTLQGYGFKTPDHSVVFVRPGDEIYGTAQILSSQGELPQDIVEAVLEVGFKKFQAEMERFRKLKETAESMPILESQFGEEYRAILKKLHESMRADQLRVQLEILEERARQKGFSSVQDMGEVAQGELKALKERIGEADFETLVEMNRGQQS